MRLKLHLKVFYTLALLTFTVFSLNSTAQYAENESVNGDFSAGSEGWDFVVRSGYEAAFAVNNGEATVNVTVTDGNNNKILLYNDTVSGLSATNQYKVSIRMKADVADAVFSLKMFAYDASGGKKTRSSDDLYATTDWKEFSWIYNSNADFLDSYQFQLRFQSVAQYTFDDLKIQKITGIANGSFEEPDGFAWIPSITTDYGTAASVEITDASPYEGTLSAMANVTASDDTASHVSFDNDTKLWITPGTEYALSFFAKGDAGNRIISNLQLFNLAESFTASLPDTFELTDSYQQYSALYTFPDTISLIKAKLFFGLDVGTYYVDNVTFAEAGALGITSNPVTTATVGQPYEYQVTYDGDGTFSLSTDPVASWLSIDANGLLSGTPDAEGNINVTITLDNGVKTATQDFVLAVSPGVGIDQHGTNAFRMYPNPGHGQVTLDGLEAGNTINIYDITGKEVMHFYNEGDQVIIPLDGLSRGIYFVKAGKDYAIQKLIVQ